MARSVLQLYTEAKFVSELIVIRRRKERNGMEWKECIRSSLTRSAGRKSGEQNDTKGRDENDTNEGTTGDRSIVR